MIDAMLITRCMLECMCIDDNILNEPLMRLRCKI